MSILNKAPLTESSVHSGDGYTIGRGYAARRIEPKMTTAQSFAADPARKPNTRSLPVHPASRVSGVRGSQGSNPFLRGSGPLPGMDNSRTSGLTARPGVRTATPETSARTLPVPMKVLPRGFRGSDAAAVAKWCADPTLPGLRATLFSVGGGVGVSTVTAAIGGLVAALSADPVVALELADRPWSGLSRRIAGEPQALSVAQWRQHLAVAADPVSALKFVPAGPSGLHVLGAAEEQLKWWVDTTPPAVGVFVDAGSWESNPGLPGLLARWRPATVMVVRADAGGVDAALVGLGQLRSRADGRSPEVLLVLVDTGGYGRVAVKAATQLAGSVAQVVTVGQSEALRREPLRIDQLEKPTAAAIAKIVHHIADRTWRSGAAAAAADMAPPGGVATVPPTQPPSPSPQEETA